VLAQVLLYDGWDDLDGFGPYEVLANAARAGADLDVELVTLAPQETVLSSHGARVIPHTTLADRLHLLVVPGGGWNDRSPQGARTEAERGELPRAIAERHARGATVASVCTGAGILAAAGMLDGRPAATHHAAADELRGRGLEIVDARVVDDGDLVSCGGVTSGLDLALHLVHREFGEELATLVAREMEHDRVGEVHRGPRATQPA
jgi:transcriptional regulator GlxA family with amidase domain